MGLTTLFCEIHDFCQNFEPEYHKHLIDDGKIKRVRKSTLSFIFFSLIFDIWSSNPLTRLVSGRGSETARGRVTEFPWIRVFFGLTVNTAENDRHFPRQPTPINSGFGGITFVSSISGIAEVHCLCVIEKKVSIFKLKSKHRVSVDSTRVTTNPQLMHIGS